ncbi:MAG: molybdate ABC transporter ATP-binding protein ModF [Akkermansiaceae bacterium]|nr:molybdate ABC transporter ATP-binding protein ModF [Akkermansiaceae bacterium]
MSSSSTPPAALISLSGIGQGAASRQVAVQEFQILPGEQWAVIGGNGSGKTTFARMLAGELVLPAGQRVAHFPHCQSVGLVSFEAEQALLEREIYEDDTDVLDRIDYGRTTYELITELLSPDTSVDEIIRVLQLEEFLHTGFRQLSTGERRRMMIARALSQTPGMLVLDEPYDGLDREFTRHLKTLLAGLSERMPMVIIVNRMSHIGAHITHLACLHDMKLVLDGRREEIEQSALWRQLHALDTQEVDLPSTLPGTEPYQPAAGQPIIDMHSVAVGYHDKQIISNLDWRIMPGEHWKISGPNGSGKSTLVNLVSGDHPQCYSNEIHLFGSRRGNGESIWDIKHHMGLMSTSLHQQYRVTVNAETVLLSGFFDSIGVYRPVSGLHRQIAGEWLEFIHLAQHRHTHFQKLSFGQQRMLLIARALIKRPYLLILDEPCQGLDPINRALVIGLIDKIARRNIAQVLYISHDDEDDLKCITHQLDFIRRHDKACGEPPFLIRLSKVADYATNNAD